MSAPKSNKPNTAEPAPGNQNKTAGSRGRSLPPAASRPETWNGALDSLRGRRMVLVVTGGVAAYKAAELTRMWARAGAEVRVVLTENAARFITTLTFESLTGQPAFLDMWTRPQFEIEHISLASWAEVAVVAPATADFLAKMAHGLADDFATTFMLAVESPKLAAPAMNSRMLAAPATRTNLDILTEHGVSIIKPAAGLLACGDVGDGRLAELETIAISAARILAPKDFRGRRITVSAGATREPWDDIRFISNRSSGRMGLDLALAAWLRGAEVDLIVGPAVEPPPPLAGLNFRMVETTADMLAAVEESLGEPPSPFPDDQAKAQGPSAAQTLIMAAAPADFRPAQITAGKIKKSRGLPRMDLAMAPDILKSLPRRPGCLYIGFAAEDDDLVIRAQSKLKGKDLDLVAANQAGGAGSAFAATENRLWLVFRDGRKEEITTRPKFAAAWALLDAILTLEPRTEC